MSLPLPWPFERQYMQVALMVGAVVGACAPLVGSFMVQKRLSLMGDGIGHVAFAGVAGGLLLGVWPVWSALVMAVAGALAVEWLRLRRGAPGDLALALLFYSGIAGGAVLAGLAGSLDASVLGYLFGSILTIEPAEAVPVAGAGLVVLVVVAVCWRALFAVALDEEAARVAGLPVDGLSLGLAALVAVSVVAAMQVVGVLLVAALMVLPVGAAQRLTASFRASLAVAAGIGVASSILGLTAARAFGLAPGGSIVLVAAAGFLVASLRPRATIPGRS